MCILLPRMVPFNSSHMLCSTPNALLFPMPIPCQSGDTLDARSNQKSQTQTKSNQTTAKNPNHTLQPTPVFSAILNIRRIVPFNRTPVPSNLSLIFPARSLLSRISSPIAMVNCFNCPTFCDRSVVAVLSFCDSSSSSTDVGYCPFRLGVAGRNPE